MAGFLRSRFQYLNSYRRRWDKVCKSTEGIPRLVKQYFNGRSPVKLSLVQCGWVGVYLVRLYTTLASRYRNQREGWHYEH
jgi:hypothetical protein